MITGEQGYLDLVRRILADGDRKPDRTGVGTLSLFGEILKFSLDRFPLLTTKKINIKLIAVELEWFLSGSVNIKFLEENNVKIWTEWPFKEYLLVTKQPVPQPNSPEWIDGLQAYRHKIIYEPGFAEQYGGIGAGGYGKMWRYWPDAKGGTIDQLQEIVDTIKRDAYNRRLVVVGYNASLKKETLLPPCHSLFQFSVTSNGRLNCILYQRSGDMFLGIPFNIASYALLTYIIASICDLQPGVFTHVIADAHVYNNHVIQCETQLQREVLLPPALELPKLNSLGDFRWQMAVKGLSEYQAHPAIKAEVAI